MVKYILNSGGIDHSEDKGRKFYNEIVYSLGQSPKILLCLFAQEERLWGARFRTYKNNFASLLGSNVKPIFSLAIPEKFTQQVESSDAIYIHGGDEEPLFRLLSGYNFNRLFNEKVIATNSASSNLISKYYYCVDRRRVEQGLGVLNIKFLPHYQSNYGSETINGPVNWRKAYNELLDYKDKTIPLYALKEGEFNVFTAIE